MKALSSKQLREEWNKFRLAKKHVYLPESSLIGGKESTAMFTIAGMQQVIPYLSGKEHPLGKRLFNIQKCIRTVDIDEVGDASHQTFFEMMGNRSLGDYFKKESVQRSREFLVDVLEFDPKKLAVTVFEGDKQVPLDTETIGYRKNAGLPEERICPMPAENNRRSPGPIGPCGPDTEIFYRVGKTKLPPKGSTPKSDEHNRLEIWNNVFMEYYRDEKGQLANLKNQNVDTGMGFERMCMVLQEKKSAYETDLFSPMLDVITTYIGLPYTGNERRYRIIADHLRTAFFLIKDGLTPSNEGRGYVLRRLVRRMYYNMMLLKEIDKKTFINFLNEEIDLIASSFGLTTNQDQIVATLEKETTQFQKTIAHGQKLLHEIFSKQKKGNIIMGKDIFMLYDTFGFPLELTREIALENGYKIDEVGFEQAMQQQQERSRAGSKDMFKQGIDWGIYLEGIPTTKFIGYDALDSEVKLLKDFEVNGQKILVFDKTPFYAESGGQRGDSGRLILDDGTNVNVVQVQKFNDIFLHFVGK